MQIGHRVAGVSRGPVRPLGLLAAPLDEREARRHPRAGHLRRPHPQRPQRTHRLYEVIPPSAAPAILDLPAGTTAAARAQRHVDRGTEVS